VELVTAVLQRRDPIGEIREVVFLDGFPRCLDRLRNTVESVQRVPGSIAVDGRRCGVELFRSASERSGRALACVALGLSPVPESIVSTIAAISVVPRPPSSEARVVTRSARSP
jgi:hypothetical protein